MYFLMNGRFYSGNLDTGGPNEIIADSNSPAVPGQSYQTIQGAVDYAVTLTPSATNPVAVRVMSGYYVECVTLSAYITLVADGHVEIQTATDNTAALTLASNCEVYGIVCRATAGAGVRGIYASGAFDVLLQDVRSYVDDGTTVSTDALVTDNVNGVSGTFTNCIFDSRYDAIAVLVGNGKTLTMKGCTCRGWVGTEVAITRCSGGLIKGELGGTFYAKGCTFEGHTIGANTTPAYGLNDYWVGGGSGLSAPTITLDECTIKARGASTGAVEGFRSNRTSTFVGGVTMHNCTIDVTSDNGGTCYGVSTTGTATITTVMTGGSIKVTTAGTKGDANHAASGGGITLNNVQRAGTISAGVTETTTIAANAVTLAKMANLAENTGIGRVSAGTGAPETFALTAAGRALIDDADAAAQRTTLGLANARTRQITALLTGCDTASATLEKASVCIQVAGTISRIEAKLGNGETCGATALVLDIHKVEAANADTDAGEATIYTTQGNRPSITNTHKYVLATAPDVTALAVGDWLKFLVDTAGTGVTQVAVTVTYAE